MTSNGAVRETENRASAVGAVADTRPAPAKTLGSDVWQRVAADPLVQRVKDAVEGTLLDIRPPKRAEDEIESAGESEQEEAGE